MNKQFKRMQKLAGIITEGYMGQFYAPEYLEQKYGKAIAKKIEDAVEEMDPNSWDRFTGMESAKEVEGYIKDIKDMLELTEERTVRLGKTIKIHPKDKKKMTEEGLREMLKAQILKELEEAKKKGSKKEKEPVEDIVDDTTNVDFTFNDSDMESSGEMAVPGSGDAKKVFGKLTDAFEAAKEFGDEKLIQQVANTIKYFNDNVILNTNS